MTFFPLSLLASSVGDHWLDTWLGKTQDCVWHLSLWACLPRVWEIIGWIPYWVKPKTMYDIFPLWACLPRVWEIIGWIPYWVKHKTMYDIFSLCNTYLSCYHISCKFMKYTSAIMLCFQQFSDKYIIMSNLIS